MKEKLEAIKTSALAKLDACTDSEALNEIRVEYLGKKGELTTVLKSMKDVSPEERPKVGQMVNEVRNIIEEKIEEKKTALALKEREAKLQAE
ncbi:MAG: phenylalanine--tRNA ligase subunit alpha, partial [Lachnospiraceae bacterium]